MTAEAEVAGQLRHVADGERICGACSAPGSTGAQWACTAPKDHGGPVHAAIQWNGDVFPYPGSTWPVDQAWPDIRDLAVKHGLPDSLFGLGLVLVDDGRRKITLKVTVATSELTEAAETGGRSADT